MPQRRSYLRKRAAPDAMADVGSALGEPYHDLAQTERDFKMERLREENHKLREEVAKGKSQTSLAMSLVPVVPIPKRVMRRRLDEEGISL